MQRNCKKRTARDALYRARLNVYLQESTRRKTYVEMNFCLNILPRQPNVEYQWIDIEIWDDDLLWIE